MQLEISKKTGASRTMRRVKHYVRTCHCSPVTLTYVLGVFAVSLLLIIYEQNNNYNTLKERSAATRYDVDLQIASDDTGESNSSASQRHDVIDMLSNLSFIDPFTPDCESIFLNDADKESKLAQFKDILREIERHNDLVMATKQKFIKKQGKCYVGHALNYMEETYVMAKLFR